MMEIKEACPFCKLFFPYVATIYSPGNPKRYAVECNGCGAQGPKAMTERMAIKLWNEGAALK